MSWKRIDRQSFLYPMLRTDIVGITEVGITEAGLTEVGNAEVGIAEVGIAEVKKKVVSCRVYPTGNNRNCRTYSTAVAFLKLYLTADLLPEYCR